MGQLERSGQSMVPLPAAANLLLPVMRWAREQPARGVAACRDGDHLVDVTAEDAILKEARRGEYDLIILGVTRRPGETLSFWQYGSRGARELGYVDPVCRKLESRWSWNLKKSRRGMTLSPIRRSSKTG